MLLSPRTVPKICGKGGSGVSLWYGTPRLCTVYMPERERPNIVLEWPVKEMTA